ncbi:MAG: hypothetical protein RL701_5734, partial [Pseudomonadota bacterium]
VALRCTGFSPALCTLSVSTQAQKCDDDHCVYAEIVAINEV